MRDRADAADAVPELEMPVGVPGQRRHPVAAPHPLPLQPLRNLQRPLPDPGIAAAPQAAILDCAAHHFARAVLDRCVVDDPVEQKRPVLHQAEHALILPNSMILWRG